MLPKSLHSIFSDDSIFESDEAHALYGRNLTNTTRKITGAVRPKTAEQVSRLVKTAVANRLSLYPISKGNNWGYGAATPVTDGCVVLDLSDMNEIEVVDELEGIFSIEPGVTQQDLFDFLRNRSLDFFVPTTGAGPAASLLGNALERGFGLTPLTDHWSAVVALEVVMPDGSLYQSPLLELGGPLHPWGLGPYIDGLFSQGAFGIVTRVHIRLARRPLKVLAFRFEGPDLGDIGIALADIQQQRLSTIWGVNVMNTLRLASMTTRYPSENSPLSDFEIQQLRKANGLAPWNVVGVIGGPSEVVAGSKKYLTKTLRKHGFRVRYLSQRGVTNMQRMVSKLFPNSQLHRRLEFVERSFRAICGEPTLAAHCLLRWRAGATVVSSPPGSPLDSDVGLLWFCPLVPMKREVLTEFYCLVNSVIRQYGINPLVTLSMFTSSYAFATIPLTFCRTDDDAVENAFQCFRKLAEKCATLGLYPYRIPTQFMKELTPKTKHSDLVCRLKKAIDPENIISPGRYC